MSRYIDADKCTKLLVPMKRLTTSYPVTELVEMLVVTEDVPTEDVIPNESNYELGIMN